MEDAAVVAVPAPRHVGCQLVMFVVGGKDATSKKAFLREQLARRLPRYMLPSDMLLPDPPAADPNRSVSMTRALAGRRRKAS